MTNKLNKLKNLFFSSTIFLSIVSSPLEASSTKKILRIGAIPDQNQEVLDRRFNLLSKGLSKKLNLEVKYIPVTDYISAVTSFRNNNLDLVWFGGLTGVQARLQTPNSIVLTQRDVDKEFKSAFIINKRLGIKPTNDINKLKLLKGLRFSFGSENSTSGRLMPQYFLNKVGVTIKDFKGKRAGFSGSHDATIALVNSGAFDSGALNIQILKKNIKKYPKRTKNITIFFITPGYSDYHWLAQGNLDQKFRKGFTKDLKRFFIGLNQKNQKDKKILEMFNANKFIDANKTDYKMIQSIARKIKKIR